MTQNTEAADKLAAHMARLQVTGAVPMTPEEILAGNTQGGVPRPACLVDDRVDDVIQPEGVTP